MANNYLYANVLLPLPVKGYFTYLIPASLTGKAEEGKRVIVPFGSKKLYAGLIKSLHSSSSGGDNIKEIISILDDKPLISSLHFSFWEWMADYYLCTTGEVMNAALPAAMKLSSETTIKTNPSISLENYSFSVQETNLLKELQKKKKLTVNETIKTTGIKKIMPLINNLLEKQAIIAQEYVQETYKPKKEKFVKLTPEYENNEEKLKDCFDYAEKKAPRQLEMLVAFIRLSGRYEPTQKEVTQKELAAKVGGGHAVLQSMIKKGIFELYSKKYILKK